MLWSITEGTAGIVAVGTNGRIVHSTDGRAWTTRASGSSAWLVAVTFGAGRYVAVGEAGTILRSTDAVTWTRVAASGTTARLNNVVFAQDKFVAVGEAGAIVVSSDGSSWLPVSSSEPNRWLRGLAFAGRRWIATGQGAIMLVSSDAVRWEAIASVTQISPRTVDFEAIAPVSASSTSWDTDILPTDYSTFAVVGSDGYAGLVIVSAGRNTDQVRRIEVFGHHHPELNSARLRSVSNVNGMFVATGENGMIATAASPERGWQRIEIATRNNLVGGGALQGSMFLVGENESVFQSGPVFTSRLANISTRGVAGSGSAAMIAGTVVTGPQPKRFLIRGVGPGLARFGVPDPLSAPVLRVFDSAGRVVAANSAWGSNLNASEIAAAAQASNAFALQANSRDAALLMTLAPGTYTFELSSVAGSGNALIEAYDLDAMNATSARAVNISTRGHVGTGDRVLIAGLVVQGQSSRNVLVRAVGPTLTRFGVSGTLVDPVITVVGADGTVLGSNDNWAAPSVVNGRPVAAEEIAAASGASGAFPLAADSRDAALLINLLPGSHTIQVSGANAGTGVALVEAYDVPTL